MISDRTVLSPIYVCNSSATGVGTEETDSVVCMLYRPFQNVRIRRPNPPLDRTHPFWRATYMITVVRQFHSGMQACVRLDDRVCSGWFAVEQGLRQECVLAPLMSNIFFAAVINVAYTRFKAEKDIMDALVHLRKKRGAGGRGEATAGEPVLATPL